MSETPTAAAAEQASDSSGTMTPAARVRGMSCPSCAGSLELRAGLRVVVCTYCRTPLLVVSEVGTRRWAVEPAVEAAAARRAAWRWLTTGWRRHRQLRREAQQGQTLMCFLPFFRFEADCIGFALGTEERRRRVGSGKHRRVETYEVDVERSVQRSFDRTYPALNVAEWGVRKVDLRGDRLVAFDPLTLERLGMVFPPTGSAAEIQAAARSQFADEADPGRGLKTVRFKFQETLRERLSVIYYPLWVVRYRFRERSYQVLVDAEDGSLVYGKAPGNDLYRAVMLVLSQAAALFVATTILQLTGVSFGGLAAMGLAVGAVLLWGWKRFRHGGVVIEGTGVERDRDVPPLLAGMSLSDAIEEAAGDLLEGRTLRWRA